MQGYDIELARQIHAVVKVPLFIEEGEMVIVDTRTGEYLSRA